MPYLDGLPVATSVSPTDIIAIDQGGTHGIPGTATTRQTTVASITGIGAGVVSVVNAIGVVTLTELVTGGVASTANTATAISTAVAVVSTAVAVETARAEAAEALLAPNASPTFTGAPAGPTAAAATATTQLATTAFVTAVASKGQFAGTTTNDNAAAGHVGEYISSTVLAGSAVSLTTATPQNVTSISLTAGDWNVWGNVTHAPNSATSVAAVYGAINTTSGTFPTSMAVGAYFAENFTPLTSYGSTKPTGMTRLSLASTTTVYLIAQAIFSINTMSAYGFIGARRVR